MPWTFLAILVCLSTAVATTTVYNGDSVGTPAELLNKISRGAAKLKQDNLNYLTFRRERSVSTYGNSEAVPKIEWNDGSFRPHNLNRGIRDEDWGWFNFDIQREAESRRERARKEEEEAAKRREEKKEAAARRNKHIKTGCIIVGVILGCAGVFYGLYKCMTGNDYRHPRDERIDNLIVENRQLNERINRICTERESARAARNNNEENVERHLVEQSVHTNLGPNPQQNMIANKTRDELPPPYEVAMANVAPSAPPCDDNEDLSVKY